jgi:hypothetical protein
MKRIAILLAAAGAAAALASGSLAGTSTATVTHYTASYYCGCFGQFTIVGVHVTNTRFPGTDNGGGDAVGGRDNFSGTVSEPPAVETVWNFANSGEWCSDYDGQCTDEWSVTFEPDGSLTGWAIYPSS